MRKTQFRHSLPALIYEENPLALFWAGDEAVVQKPSFLLTTDTAMCESLKRKYLQELKLHHTF